jgi:hypothetical protein
VSLGSCSARAPPRFQIRISIDLRVRAFGAGSSFCFAPDFFVVEQSRCAVRAADAATMDERLRSILHYDGLPMWRSPSSARMRALDKEVT